MSTNIDTPKLKNILEKTTKFFREKDFDSPRLDAELLLAKALNLRRIDLYLKYDQPLAEGELQQCRELVRRRGRGEPVAYILGTKDFYGLSFEVDQNVLIPRPETEILVESVLQQIKLKGEEPQRLLDLGCGSGCIGLSLLQNLKNTTAVFLDVSQAALDLTRKNASNLGLVSRCEFISADAATAVFSGPKFDVVVANPPYIDKQDERVQKEVVEFEPHLALFSDQKGLGANFSWSKNVLGHLNKNAIIGFEFGIDQSAPVLEHFTSLGVFNHISIIKDLSGIDRHILAIRKDS